jgi:hypothetical protein
MTRPFETVARLNAALAQLARALQTGDAQPVLEAEEPVACATAALQAVRSIGDEDRLRLQLALSSASSMLSRCRALGQAADTLRLVTEPSAYSRAGLRVVHRRPAADRGRI